MPRNNRQPALTKKHRDDMYEALEWIYEARDNCQGMHNCGFPQDDRFKKLEVAEEVIKGILREQFGE